MGMGTRSFHLSKGLMTGFFIGVQSTRDMGLLAALGILGSSQVLHPGGCIICFLTPLCLFSASSPTRGLPFVLYSSLLLSVESCALYIGVSLYINGCLFTSSVSTKHHASRECVLPYIFPGPRKTPGLE